MKKIYILLSLFPLVALGQNTQGKITYEEKIKLDMDLKLDGVENAEAIKAMLPKEQVSKKTLLFNADASIYKNQDTEEAENIQDETSVEGEGGMKIKMVMTRPQEQTYRDLKNDKITEMHDLFGKSFLVNTDAGKTPWKLVNEQKTILGYPCLKAIINDSASVTEAWYAPSIPVPSGPGAFAQLPGMILELSTDKGKTLIKAITIHMTDPGTALAAPKKGKLVTEQEFRKISEQKMKEMQESMGGAGKGNIIIRRNN